MKKPKVPRKLKKELPKIKDWVLTQPILRQMSPYGLTVREELRLHEGVKVNKWTKRLIRRMYSEKRAALKKMHEQYLKRQMSWAKKGVYPIDSLYEQAFCNKSADEFRKEYLNEPIVGDNDAVFKGLPEMGRYSRITPRQNGVEPNFMIIDDLDDLMPNFRTRKEELEWIERMKLWHASMTAPDSHGDCFAPKAIIKIKEGAINPDNIEEFKKEWDKQMKSGSPIMLKDSEASVEFIPSKRHHRLHNHPRMEAECGVEQDEVIVDNEFYHQFSWFKPLIGKDGKFVSDHIIVRKSEFLALLEGKGGGRNEAHDLLRPRYEGESFE